MLFSIHGGVAAMTACPELKLDPDDAKELGAAVAGVLAFHKVKMTAKQEAYSILFEAAAKVYPPMAVSIYMRKKMEAEEKGKVLPFKRSSQPQPAAQPQPQPQTQNVPKAPTPPPATPQPVSAIMPHGFDPRHIEMPK